MTKIWRRIAAVAGLLPLPLMGQSYQPLDSITAAAVSASKAAAQRQGYEHVEVSVKSLDTRLQLPLCGQALETLGHKRSKALGSGSVGIRCTGPKAWTIYVRTDVSAMREVPVLRRALARNSQIEPQDIKMVLMPVASTGSGLMYDPAQIVGMEVVRTLDEGSTLRVDQLRAPKVIKRGQQVTLVSSIAGLQVTSQGKALADAVAGERVMVLNNSSGQRIEGVARTDGVVSVQ
jgi:flagella basal body P-ring formation protein FlgA